MTAYNNDTINTIIKRRSIRNFKDEQIKEGELKLILNAGEYAPCAGGRQSPVFVVCQNPETNRILGEINMDCLRAAADKRPPSNDDKKEKAPALPKETLEAKSAFYGAPTVVTLFAPKGWYNFTVDCAVAAQNMMLAAESIGVGSCLIARAAESFETPEGIKLQKAWDIGDEYEAKLHVLLGYPKSVPQPKPRREGRIKIIE